MAALGIALSGCGGGSASAGASSAAATQQSAPPQAQSAGSSTPTSSTTSGTTTGSSPPTASAGNVTLNWTPPTENTDGTPLTNLAGYDIHYGTASGNYTQSIKVSNPGLATYVVQNLTPGTYYFTVSAINASGTESPLSSEVSTTVN